MKLDFQQNPVEMSAAFKSKNFGFGDGRVIMTILRSKMYSNPIQAVCQEILSNSRDANREVGKGHVPVKVRLPNRFDETISFIDEGPGISPDRMENVFILYGNSTKRSDNVQTGGFGLGAKTPFAYTDTFTITTTTEHDGKHIKRQYAAVIDESQLGLITLLSEVETDESTGTAISMAVKGNDLNKFMECIKQVATYWDVQPEVTGSPNFSFPKTDWICEGEGWGIENGHGDPLVIIDGISYRLNASLISPNGGNYHYYYNKDEFALLRHPVRLFFETGELRVTANREDLDYQPDVIDKIKVRLKKVFDELKVEAEKEISTADSLWDASILWNSGYSLYKSIIDAPQWNGKNLLSQISIPWNMSDHVKISVYEYYPSDYSVTQVKSYRRYKRTIGIKKNTLLVENDIVGGKRIDRLRLITLFEANPGITEIGVVEFTNPSVSKQHYEDNYHWSFLNPILLSTVDQKVLPKSAKKAAASRKGRKISRIKELTKRSHRSTWGDVYEWKPSTLELDDKDGGVYVILKNGKPWVNGQWVENSYIWKLKELLDIDIYGIQYKFRNKIGPNWDSLSSYAVEEIADLSKDEDVITYLKYGNTHTLESAVGSISKNLTSLSSKVENKDSLFLDFIEKSKIGNKGYEKTIRLNRLQEGLAMPVSRTKNELKKVQEKFLKTYPLFGVLDSYYYRNGKMSEIAEEIIFYINAKDSV